MANNCMRRKNCLALRGWDVLLSKKELREIDMRQCLGHGASS